jgi:antitoxin component YwqK of YwqJK toxin-antitoxin module
MPKIYEYFGLIFLFYSNDHLPVHVHVKNGDFESKFEFIYEDGKLADIKIIKTRNQF